MTSDPKQSDDCPRLSTYVLHLHAFHSSAHAHTHTHTAFYSILIPFTCYYCIIQVTIGLAVYVGWTIGTVLVRGGATSTDVDIL